MKTFWIILATLLCAASVQAGPVVIANPKNKLESLTPLQVQDIFMGRRRTFPNDRYALPIDQSSSLRAGFYERLTGRPLEQINAYWARILFTGQASPPIQLPDDASVLKAVRENEDAIGYVDSANLDNSVRVLLELP